MNAHGSFVRSGMTWQERVAVAKANPGLADVMLSILLNEADRHGDSAVVAAAQYALDTLPDIADYSELDALFEEHDRFERVLEAASFYPGGELPDWRYNQIMDGAA